MENIEPVQNTQNEGSIIQPPQPPKHEKHLGIVAVLIIGLLVAMGVAFYYLSDNDSVKSDGSLEQNAEQELPIETNEDVNPENDTTTAIDKDLEGIDIDELDSDFESIDGDLENL